MSNFDFLKDYDEDLYKLGNRIEEQVNVSPSGVKADSTTFLERVLKILLAEAGLKYDSWKDFSDQVDALFQSDLKIPYSYCEKIKDAYRFRNKIHDDFDEIEKHEYQDALQLHKKLFYIAKKLYRDYNDNYDVYKGTPSYKPIELDTTDDVIEQVKIPDFADVVDIEYDYCIICGEPNHSNYSICCEKCNRVMDNANNFISIRNAFGKNSKFTKEDLIEYGIPEGYINQLITNLVREDVLREKGREITFNNMQFDAYMSKIDKYIAVCELLTMFIDGKITPTDIKKTREYKQGSFKQDPFYQFYKFINIEIVNKFESYLITTENIWESIEFTTITPNELKRWYLIQLNNYKKGNVNESFVVFNDLLKREYINLKREGNLEKDIKKQLNVTSEVYGFWSDSDKEFLQKIEDIKRDLILKAISEHKTREEIIEIAGVTPREYDNLVKVSDFKGDELSQKRNEELDMRKQEFIGYLRDNDLETSCNLARFSLDDFYKWYNKDMTSQFYIDTTNILMDKYLDEKRKGKNKKEACEAIGLEEKYVDTWLKRTLDICERFKDRHIKVIVDLVYEGFENNKTKAEIAEIADISVKTLNGYLHLGQRGYGTYKKLYDYYEEVVIPRQLDRFLQEFRNKPIKKALEISELSKEELENCCNSVRSGDTRYKEFYDKYYTTKVNVFLDSINKRKDKSKALRNAQLSEKELNECYELGKNGDERFVEFYEKYYEMKFNGYVLDIIAGMPKSNALKKANLTEDDLKPDMDEIIFDKRLDIVITSLNKDLTTKQAAKKANVSIDDVFDWFLKGKDGDEKFKEFYDLYYEGYVSPGAKIVQKALNDDIPLNFILKKFRKHFTKEDYDFWLENGYLKEAQEEIDKEDDDEIEIKK